MKTRLFMVLLTIIVIYNKAEAKGNFVLTSPDDTIIVINNKTKVLRDSEQVQSTCSCCDSLLFDNSITYSEGISTLTLVTEAIDDMFNRVNVFVAIITSIITLAVAIMGFFGFQSIKKIKEDVKGAIPIIEEEANKLKIINEKIEKEQTLNNQYLLKINQWIFANTYAIANAPGGSLQNMRNLMGNSTLNYYLMKLYLSNDIHEIDGCINYIKTKGTLEEIEHLKFIADNDLNKYKSNKANEAIGYIRARL